MKDSAELTALLGSRICHDLISPIGAIGNGVELLMMEAATTSPEMALIAESVAAANARIRYFRVAFGLASQDQRISRAEVTGILAAVTQGGRLEIDWQATGDLARVEAKLLFLALQCLETALAFGGRITVQYEKPRWVLTAHATRTRFDPPLWERLSNPQAKAEIGPAQVHFALLPEALVLHKRKLSLEARDTEIRLSF